MGSPHPHGTGATTAGARAYPWRALAFDLETVIELTPSAQPLSLEAGKRGREIAWFPIALEHICTHPSGHTWAGSSGNYLCLFTLEGEPS